MPHLRSSAGTCHRHTVFVGGGEEAMVLSPGKLVDKRVTNIPAGRLHSSERPSP